MKTIHASEKKKMFHLEQNKLGILIQTNTELTEVLFFVSSEINVNLGCLLYSYNITLFVYSEQHIAKFGL